MGFILVTTIFLFVITKNSEMCELLNIQFFTKILPTISQTTFKVLFYSLQYTFLQFFCLSLEKRCQFKKRRNSSRFRKTKLFFHKKGAESSANEPIWQTLITRYGTVKHTTRYDSCPQKRPQGGLLIIFGKLFFLHFKWSKIIVLAKLKRGCDF